MTALSLASIPSNINSYERLAAWVIQAMQSAASGNTVKVVDGQAPIPTIQCSVGIIADGTFRYILQAYVPCDQVQLATSTAKSWMAAQDIVTAAPNTAFLTN